MGIVGKMRESTLDINDEYAEYSQPLIINTNNAITPHTTNPTNNAANNENNDNNTNNAILQLLSPACDNRMVLTLLLLLEHETINNRNKELKYDNEKYKKKIDPYAQLLASSFNCLSPLIQSTSGGVGGVVGIGGVRSGEGCSETIKGTIHLISCNTPIPCYLSAEVICPTVIHIQQLQLQQLQLQQKRERMQSGGLTGGLAGGLNLGGGLSGTYYDQDRLERPCVIVLRGLSVGINRAVKAIKNLVCY